MSLFFLLHFLCFLCVMYSCAEQRGGVVVIGKEFFSVVFVVVCAWMCGLFWVEFGLGRTL